MFIDKIAVVYPNIFHPSISMYQLPTSSSINRGEQAYTGVQLGRSLAITLISKIIQIRNRQTTTLGPLHVFPNKILKEHSHAHFVCVLFRCLLFVFFFFFLMTALTLQQCSYIVASLKYLLSNSLRKKFANHSLK